ncbi:glycoside hydrolase family 3 C-terminal domain-containing protein [Actinospica sp. MGRD01-02]|uniref:Glycoside hydrolase family 3 C-terminal domain-containing protein n=1 Tax=Actinospica acidithermotolerans TaxID=2828514 RepID=A0A941EBJ0_9ACTN|nr:glycoside hydrolase family 3 protein [Actinospica acidithermotolerans]MBR7826014.1 glycoside hydrolase family 3 C-terminal domain-containing protein [Actinospica acidithermotolerans]
MDDDRIPALEAFDAWPRLRAGLLTDPEQERRIEELLGAMTLEEKVGQMIQPELWELTPEDVREYRIGSALNGAGVWPGRKRHATAQDWVDLVDEYWQAGREAYADRPFHIPFLWATDAVHGHNNVFGATIFPHNIGLGAARDPGLVRRIGAATAREVAATSMDWTFAPAVATPRDRRWGRYYEGYSEDPAIVHALAGEAVLGLQGEATGSNADARVICAVKHWIGDGATAQGADRGEAHCDEHLLRNIHGPGFFSALAAGAQSVMISFSSWIDPADYDHTPGRETAFNHKIHGSRRLITDVLKRAMGFEGVVISDWDAHAEVSGCTMQDAGYAINAGIDVLMVAARDAWQGVYHTTIRQVHDGTIPLLRIDDAVRRILRMKMRAGLWDKPRPRERALAGNVSVLGSPDHRAVAREAVRGSLVLLKNAGGVLPLARETRVLICGSGADDIRKQTGGWTLSWQGDDISLDDLPGAQTLADALRAEFGTDRCLLDPDLEQADPAEYDVAVVAIGEDSYAEMRGTIKPWGTLDYAGLKLSYARDLELLRRLRSTGVRIVTVLYGGRPMYTTEEINLSDAFVVAWLPGTEGGGVADVLVAGQDGLPQYDFRGRLPCNWPRSRDSMAANSIPAHIPGYRVPAEEQEPTGPHEPLFALGYGLDYASADPGPGVLPLDERIDEDPVPAVSGPLRILGPDAGAEYAWLLAGHQMWTRQQVVPGTPAQFTILRVGTCEGREPTEGLALEFTGYIAFICAQASSKRPRDLRGYLEREGRLAFEVRVWQPPTEPVYVACHDDFPAQPGLDISGLLHAAPEGEWVGFSFPLAQLRDLGMRFKHVDVPFMLYSTGKARFDIADVRWEPAD